MTTTVRRRLWLPSAAAVTLVLAVVTALTGASARPASAEGYTPINGAGSTWSQIAIEQWGKGVAQYGMRVNYAGTGSSDGRNQFVNGTVDFAASDIPFQFHPEDGSNPETPAKGSYAYMPVTAGGTVLMYNLTINGQQVTNMRLSGDNATKIFTGAITNWSDPALAADNPGLTMPNRKITPVVRSDGSGSTAQFSLWMISQHGDLWNDYCRRSGRAPRCGQTSFYPTTPGMIAQAGDLGVAGYIRQSYADGAIGYVNYAYAKESGFPVAKLLNAANYYTEPTPENVAVSLLKAQINTDANAEDYLTQRLEGVYNNADPRTYPLSSYSYMILPTVVKGQFNLAKGKTLGAFSYYAMCQGQQQAGKLGYSPMPINLVQASFDQIRRIPGVQTQDIDLKGCNNPTFSPDGHNVLADTAPMPAECDKKGGPTQCSTGTGGATAETPTKGGGGDAAAGPGGAGGAGSGAGTGAAGGAGSAAGGGAGEQVCDPDTGVCTAASGAGSGSGGEAASGPVGLAAHSGWTGTQTLMLLAGLLLLALVLAPGITAVVLSKRQDTS